MAVEDDDIGDREVWTKASRLWSSTTSAGPTTLTKRGQPFNTPALEVLTSAHSSFPSKFWCSRFRFRFQFQLPFFRFTNILLIHLHTPQHQHRNILRSLRYTRPPSRSHPVHAHVPFIRSTRSYMNQILSLLCYGKQTTTFRYISGIRMVRIHKSYHHR